MNVGAWGESLLDLSLSFPVLKDSTGAVPSGFALESWQSCGLGRGGGDWPRLEPAMGFRWLSEASFQGLTVSPPWAGRRAEVQP